MDIGRAVKTLRSQRGLKQQELETKAQLGNTYATLLEGHNGNPRLSTLIKLSKALDVPPVLLLFAASDAEDLEGVPQQVIDRLAGLLWQANSIVK